MKFYLEEYCLFFRNNMQKLFVKCIILGQKLKWGCMLLLKNRSNNFYSSKILFGGICIMSLVFKV